MGFRVIVSTSAVLLCRLPIVVSAIVVATRSPTNERTTRFARDDGRCAAALAAAAAAALVSALSLFLSTLLVCPSACVALVHDSTCCPS